MSSLLLDNNANTHTNSHKQTHTHTLTLVTFNSRNRECGCNERMQSCSNALSFYLAVSALCQCYYYFYFHPLWMDETAAITGSPSAAQSDSLVRSRLFTCKLQQTGNMLLVRPATSCRLERARRRTYLTAHLLTASASASASASAQHRPNNHRLTDELCELLSWLLLASLLLFASHRWQVHHCCCCCCALARKVSRRSQQ